MTPYFEQDGITVYNADCREALASLPDASVQCCITSPPYFGLRSYLDAGHPDKAAELGSEASPDAYVAEMVAIFREVRRVLRDDGTVWLNLGDSYAGSWGNYSGQNRGKGDSQRPITVGSLPTKAWDGREHERPAASRKQAGLKEKDLIGIPWRVAFALQEDGWWLRSDIVWHKPNPMPESVTDRPTRSHEYLFLFSKRERYHYDAGAIAEPAIAGWRGSTFTAGKTAAPRANVGQRPRVEGEMRNKRTVWTVASQGYEGAHFATFPPKLIEPCILAGCPVGGVVLDPFMGSGTTGLVSMKHGRAFIGIELNEDYIKMAIDRLSQPALPMQFEQVEQGHCSGEASVFGQSVLPLGA